MPVTTQLTLTSKTIGDTIHLAESWISNGHWAIRRSRVANSLLCTQDTVQAAIKGITSVRTIGDTMIETIIDGARTKPRSWVVSSWVVESAARTYGRRSKGKIGRYRLATATDNGEPAYFDAAYLEALGIEIGDTIYAADSKSAFIDSNIDGGTTIVIMPYRAEADTTPIVSVASYLGSMPADWEAIKRAS